MPRSFSSVSGSSLLIHTSLAKSGAGPRSGGLVVTGRGGVVGDDDGREGCSVGVGEATGKDDWGGAVGDATGEDGCGVGVGDAIDGEVPGTDVAGAGSDEQAPNTKSANTKARYLDRLRILITPPADSLTTIAYKRITGSLRTCDISTSSLTAPSR